MATPSTGDGPAVIISSTVAAAAAREAISSSPLYLAMLRLTLESPDVGASRAQAARDVWPYFKMDLRCCWLLCSRCARDTLGRARGVCVAEYAMYPGQP